MLTIKRMLIVVLTFMLMTLILYLDPLLSAKLAKIDSKKEKDCTNNYFSGKWQPVNAVWYMLIRQIAGYSATVVSLWIFWKKLTSKGNRKLMNSFSSDYNDTQTKFLRDYTKSKTYLDN